MRTVESFLIGLKRAEEWERDDEVDRELIESSSSYALGLSLDIFKFHLFTCPLVLSSIFQHSLWGFESFTR